MAKHRRTQRPDSRSGRPWSFVPLEPRLLLAGDLAIEPLIAAVTSTRFESAHTTSEATASTSHHGDSHQRSIADNRVAAESRATWVSVSSAGSAQQSSVETAVRPSSRGGTVMSPQSARSDSTTQSPSTTRSRVQTKPNSETQSSTSSSVVEPPDTRSSQGPSKTADVRSNDVHSNELRSHHADDSQLHDKESDTISDSISIDQTKSESGVKLPTDANTAMSDPSSQLAWANQHSATASATTLLTPTATANQHFLGFENANAGSTASFAANTTLAQETPTPQVQNTASDANRSGSNDALRDKLAAANHPNVANVNTRAPKLSPDHPNTTASSDIFDAPLSSSPLVFANNLPASKKWLQTITTPGRALDPLEASQLSRQISSLNYLDPVTGYSQSDSS